MDARPAHCPDEQTVLGYVHRTLAAEQHAFVESHLEACADCRTLIAALSEHVPDPADWLSSTAAASGQRDPDQAIPAGELVGRYRLERVLGTGAMGIVYSAWDPELARRVALKILRAQNSPGAMEELEVRLRREAQAVARVSHDNVVAVYDVGRHGAQLFIAMELVEGETLRQALARTRTELEVLDLFLKAGRGLHAAHQAGLVHRDFKPDNVLVAADGRVKVSDFGLARATGNVRHDAGPLFQAETFRTQAGALVGTPAYMAPEQFDGAGASEKTDLFSFCVALFEGLTGSLPFPGDTLLALANSVRAGAIREPPRSRLSGWLRRLICQGLATNPAARPASMAEVLTTLERGLARQARRRALWLGGAVAVVALAGVAGAVEWRLSERRALCSGAAQQLAGVWGPPQRQAVEKAFLGSNRPFAKDALATALRELDAYAALWVYTRTDACEATRLRGERSEELLELAFSCLDGRGKELEAVVGLLSHADDELIRSAGPLTRNLSSLEPCTNTRVLRARFTPPKDVTQTEAMRTLFERLAQNRALLLAGKYQQALGPAEDALAQARQARYRPVEATALLQLGMARDSLNDAAGAEKALRESIEAARAAGDDGVTAAAQAQLVFLVGNLQGRFAEGHALARDAHITLERMGGDPATEGSVRSNEAVVYSAEGKHAEAIKELEAAVRLHEQAGPDHRDNLAIALVNLAREHLALGDPNRALELEQRALQLQEVALGKDHPDLALTYEQLGNTLSMLHRGEEALTFNRRALAVREGAFGPEHAYVGVAWGGVAYTLAGLGRHQEAIEANRRSLEILEKALGPENVELASTLVNLGESLRAVGHAHEARALLERAEAIMLKQLGPEHPNLAYPWLNLGELALDEGRLEDALGFSLRALARCELALGADNPQLIVPLDLVGAIELRRGRAKESLSRFERARAIAAKAHGDDAPELAAPLGGVADARAALGQHAEAVPLLERALALVAKAPERTPGDTGRLKLSLAKALVKLREDPDRARQLADEAVAELALLGPVGARELAEARRLRVSLGR